MRVPTPTPTPASISPPTPGPISPPFPPNESSDCEIIYAINRTTNALSTIDIETQTQSEQGKGNFFRTIDIAYDVINGYIQSSRERLRFLSNETSALCPINPVTAFAFNCIEDPFPGRLSSLQYINDVLYGIYSGGGEPGAPFQSLMTVDIKTGALISSTGVIGSYPAPIVELAYDTSTGVLLWGLARRSKQCARCSEFLSLRTIDVETGAQGGGTGIDFGIHSIAFGPDGKLYGTLVDRVSQVASICQIDLATGECTVLFQGGGDSMTCGPVVAA